MSETGLTRSSDVSHGWMSSTGSAPYAHIAKRAWPKPRPWVFSRTEGLFPVLVSPA